MKVIKGERKTFGIDINDPICKDNYIEVTEWTNLEGYAIEVFRHQSYGIDVNINLNYSEILALSKVLKTIIKDDSRA